MSEKYLREILQKLGFDPDLPRSEYVQIGKYIYPKSAPVTLCWEGEYGEFKSHTSWYYEENGELIEERLTAWGLEGKQSDHVVYGGTYWEDTRTGIQARITQSWDSLESLMNQCDESQIALADQMTLALPIGSIIITDLTFTKKWNVSLYRKLQSKEKDQAAQRKPPKVRIKLQRPFFQTGFAISYWCDSV